MKEMSMRRWISCSAAVFLVGFACAQKEADLPAAAKQSLARMDAVVAQAKKKAVAELTSIMSTETRAGHLDVAMRVNDTVKAIAAEIEDLPPQRETRDGKTVWTLTGKNSKSEPVSMVKEE